MITLKDTFLWDFRSVGWTTATFNSVILLCTIIIDTVPQIKIIQVLMPAGDAFFTAKIITVEKL